MKTFILEQRFPTPVDLEHLLRGSEEMDWMDCIEIWYKYPWLPEDAAFGDPLTFPLRLTFTFVFSGEMSHQLIAITFGTDIYVPLRMN